MKNIKFYLLSLVTAGVIFAGCGKENPVPPTYASVLYLNAAATPLTNQANVLSSLYMDDSLYYQGLVNYGSNTGYLGVLAGVHTFTLRQDKGTYSATAPVVAVDGPAPYAVNQAFTLVSFDSLSTANRIQVIKLTDDLTLPDLNEAKVRFLQLAAGFPTTAAPSVDITFLRTSVTPNDSVTLTNRTFPTPSASGDNSPFTKIPDGTYTLKLKSPGTQTLVAGAVTTTIGKRRIYTFYYSGKGGGRTPAFGVLTHF